MNKRINKYRAWDGKRMTNSGIMFNTTTGEVEAAANMPLMQFTGLFDKNGFEIYEGDVLKSKYRIGKVIWDDGFCGFSLVTESNKSKTESSISHPTITSSEVIGNIYENPELIAQTTE